MLRLLQLSWAASSNDSKTRGFARATSIEAGRMCAGSAQTRRWLDTAKWEHSSVTSRTRLMGRRLGPFSTMSRRLTMKQPVKSHWMPLAANEEDLSDLANWQRLRGKPHWKAKWGHSLSGRRRYVALFWQRPGMDTRSGLGVHRAEPERIERNLGQLQ